MFFLLRAAFWLTIVIMFIPGNPQSGSVAPRVTLVQAFLAAQATVADFSQFCDRNPDVCSTGRAALDVLTDKAQNGLRMLSRYFDNKDAKSTDTGTLKQEDIKPEWHDPHNRAA